MTDQVARPAAPWRRVLFVTGRLAEPALRQLVTAVSTLPVSPEAYDALLRELTRPEPALELVAGVVASDMSSAENPQALDSIRLALS